MEYRRLGRTGFCTPVLAFGTATFGGSTDFFQKWGKTDVEEASRLIDICLDAGITFSIPLMPILAEQLRRFSATLSANVAHRPLWRRKWVIARILDAMASAHHVTISSPLAKRR
jgi:hypothetical protein